MEYSIFLAQLVVSFNYTRKLLTCSTLPKHFPVSTKWQSGHYFALFCKQIWGKGNAVSLHMQNIVHFLERVPAQVFDELINGTFGRSICTFDY